MTVLWGSNRFVDCATLVGQAGNAVLVVWSNPLRLSLSTPPRAPGPNLSVIENQPDPADPDTRVIGAGTDQVALWRGPDLLVLARSVDPDTVRLKVDLRPVGVAIHDAGDQLFLGSQVLEGNSLEGFSTAIELS